MRILLELVFLLFLGVASEIILTINGPSQWRSGLTISQRYVDQGAVCEDRNPHARELKGWLKTPNVSGVDAVRLDTPGKYRVKYSCDGVEKTRTVIVDRGYNPSCSEVTVGIEKGGKLPASFPPEFGKPMRYALTAQLHDGAPIYRRVDGAVQPGIHDPSHLFYTFDKKLQRGAWHIASTFSAILVFDHRLLCWSLFICFSGWDHIESSGWGSTKSLNSGLRSVSDSVVPERVPKHSWTFWKTGWESFSSFSVTCITEKVGDSVLVADSTLTCVLRSVLCYDLAEKLLARWCCTAGRSECK
jgi:hypothetical protein